VAFAVFCSSLARLKPQHSKKDGICHPFFMVAWPPQTDELVVLYFDKFVAYCHTILFLLGTVLVHFDSGKSL
jgi:hypothetical protein